MRVLQDASAPARTIEFGTYRVGFLTGIDQAMAIRPEDRPQTIEALRAYLFEPSASDRGQQAPEPDVPGASDSIKPPKSATTGNGDRPLPPALWLTGPRRGAAAGLAVVALMGAAYFFGMRQVDRPGGAALKPAPVTSVTSATKATAKEPLVPAAPPLKQSPAAAAAPRCEGVEAGVAGVRRCLKAGEVFRDCPECPEMVVIPAGRFRRGSPALEAGRSVNEDPQREVTIAKPFAVGTHEVTASQWEACAAGGRCETVASADFGLSRDRRPVVEVSWNDAKRYLTWLSSKVPATHYRLLSEAEWEYAARGGPRSARGGDASYPWGDALDRPNANCKGCGSRWDNRQPAPVASFAANGFGLYDMHGNVAEWVEDCFLSDYHSAPIDGAAFALTRSNCLRRVARGGSWRSSPAEIRSSARDWFGPDTRTNNVGFRVARSLD